jgi:hypothetical protein
MLWLLYFNIFFIYALAPVAKIFNLVPFLIGRVSLLLGQEIPVVQEAPSCSLLPNNIGHKYVITGIQETRKSRDPNLESNIYIYMLVY